MGFGTNGNDNLIGMSGRDFLYGEDGDDSLSGGGGDDVLRGGAGSDVLDGGAGSDILDAGAGDDVLGGGADIDHATFHGPRSNFTIIKTANGYTVTDNVGSEGIDMLTDIEWISFDDRSVALTGTTEFDDYLFGTSGNDFLVGGAGNDTIDSGVGANDNLYGDDSHLQGGRRNIGIDTVVIHGPRSDFRITYENNIFAVADEVGAQGNFSLFDIEFIRFDDQTLALDGTSYLATGRRLFGGGGSDTLIGSQGSDSLYGGAGDDLLDGNGRKFEGSMFVSESTGDYLEGGDGDDILLAGNGDDILNGGNDNDYIYSVGGSDTIDGGSGVDVVSLAGVRSDYTLTKTATGYMVTGIDRTSVGGTAQMAIKGGIQILTNVEWLQFQDQKVLRLSAVDEGNHGRTFDGSAGQDFLSGSFGDDYLNGFAGDDNINGSPGNDTIDGGAGSDTVTVTGHRSDYTVTKTTTGYLIADIVRGTGTDMLLNVEWLKFQPNVPAFSDPDHPLYRAEYLKIASAVALKGGTGIDTVIMTDVQSDFTVTKLRKDAFIVNDASGANVAVCRDVEQIQFSDKLLNLSEISVSNSLDSTLAQIYVAAFRRAPETAGFNYWTQELAAQGITAVADIIFSLDVVKAIYPANMTSSQFVTAVYTNVFNKSPDTDGLDYWIQQLSAKSRGQLVIDMTNAALTVPDGVDGKDYFQNRLDWSLYAVDYQREQGRELTPSQLTTLTDGITADTNTLVTLVGQAEAGVII